MYALMRLQCNDACGEWLGLQTCDEAKGIGERDAEAHHILDLELACQQEQEQACRTHTLQTHIPVYRVGLQKY